MLKVALLAALLETTVPASLEVAFEESATAAFDVSLHGVGTSAAAESAVELAAVAAMSVELLASTAVAEASIALAAVSTVAVELLASTVATEVSVPLAGVATTVVELLASAEGVLAAPCATSRRSGEPLEGGMGTTYADAWEARSPNATDGKKG